MTAKLFVPAGAPDQLSWGDRFPFAYTWASGRLPSSVKPDEVRVKVILALRTC